jgi:hypothetical protein
VLFRSGASHFGCILKGNSGDKGLLLDLLVTVRLVMMKLIKVCSHWWQDSYESRHSSDCDFRTPNINNIL